MWLCCSGGASGHVTLVNASSVRCLGGTTQTPAPSVLHPPSGTRNVSNKWGFVSFRHRTCRGCPGVVFFLDNYSLISIPLSCELWAHHSTQTALMTFSWHHTVHLFPVLFYWTSMLPLPAFYYKLSFHSIFIYSAFYNKIVSRCFTESETRSQIDTQRPLPGAASAIAFYALFQPAVLFMYVFFKLCWKCLFL